MNFMKKNDKPQKINIGTVTGAIGLKGEIKIFYPAHDPAMLSELQSLLIGDAVFEIENVRYKKKTPILRLIGIDDRNSAETLIKKDIFIKEELLPDLPDGSYYIRDLAGLSVISAEDGSIIGTVRNVITNTAQDTYEIETEEGKTLLLPAITEFIIEFDFERKTVKVNLPEGIEEILY